MVKTIVRWFLTVAMVSVGVLHFVQPEGFVAIVPEVLPAKLALVYISGVAEIAGGLGLILPATRRLAAWGLIALYVAVFPANINMAVNQLPLGDQVLEPWQLWARLPFQLLFIGLAYWMTRPDAAGGARVAPATAETSTIR
jgi:uncharacterized membrane protein